MIIAFALLFCFIHVIVDIVFSDLSKRTLWECLSILVFSVVCYWFGFKLC
jgi:hypothetical protein